MKSNICLPIGVLIVALPTAHLGWSAESSRSATGNPSAGTTASRSAAGRSNSAKGPLPDPALLDGAVQPAEKKSEYGMLGDFELPGDENVKDGKVGGQQNPNATSSGGQNSNQSMGMPQGGGGAQSQQQNGAQGGAQGGQQGGQQGGAGGTQGGPQGQQGGGPAGGGGQAGPENANAAGNPVGGTGDAGAQPQGIQVAELGGGASGQQGGAPGGNAGGKPQAMAIGDKAMRIEPGTPVPGVVGAPQKQIADGHVQQHDKGTGTGGKGPTGQQGPGRIEKGRAIPAGL